MSYGDEGWLTTPEQMEVIRRRNRRFWAIVLGVPVVILVLLVVAVRVLHS